MKEIISFFVGQAGVQTGVSMWELFCAEHNVSVEGVNGEHAIENESMETFFQRTACNTWVPRCLFIDLEPNVIDEIRSGVYRRLFHPDRLLNGPEDAANNFSRGFFTVGKLLLGSINNEFRHLIEQCDMVQGMLLLRSLGGGTGAGLTSAMFESLSDFPKTPKVEMPIYPSPTLSTSMVEPYNCLLGEHFCMEDIDVGLLLDNEAMFDLCSRYINMTYPTYNTINRLIAQVASSITASVRFENVLNCDLTVLQTNLVPYPRIHFPLCNFAPILSQDRAQHQRLSVQELTRMVFDRENQMMKIDHFYGKFMSCALFYRGNVCPQHVYMALSEIKRDKSIEFVDWCPTGFKVGINAVNPYIIPESMFAETNRNVAMLTNTSAIGQAWQRLTHRFYLLYSKRSFVHWFVGEGMEECEFTEALYNISALVKDYEEAGESTTNVYENYKKENNEAEAILPPSVPLNAKNGDEDEENPDDVTTNETDKSASNSALPYGLKHVLNRALSIRGTTEGMIQGSILNKEDNVPKLEVTSAIPEKEIKVLDQLHNEVLGNRASLKSVSRKSENTQSETFKSDVSKSDTFKSDTIIKSKSSLNSKVSDNNSTFPKLNDMAAVESEGAVESEPILESEASESFVSNKIYKQNNFKPSSSTEKSQSYINSNKLQLPLEISNRLNNRSSENSIICQKPDFKFISNRSDCRYEGRYDESDENELDYCDYDDESNVNDGDDDDDDDDDDEDEDDDDDDDDDDNNYQDMNWIYKDDDCFSVINKSNLFRSERNLSKRYQNNILKTPPNNNSQAVVKYSSFVEQPPILFHNNFSTKRSDSTRNNLLNLCTRKSRYYKSSSQLDRKRHHKSSSSTSLIGKSNDYSLDLPIEIDCHIQQNSQNIQPIGSKIRNSNMVKSNSENSKLNLFEDKIANKYYGENLSSLFSSKINSVDADLIKGDTKNSYKNSLDSEQSDNDIIPFESNVFFDYDINKCRDKCNNRSQSPNELVKINSNNLNYDALNTIQCNKNTFKQGRETNNVLTNSNESNNYFYNNNREILNRHKISSLLELNKNQHKNMQLDKSRIKNINNDFNVQYPIKSKIFKTQLYSRNKKKVSIFKDVKLKPNLNNKLNCNSEISEIYDDNIFNSKPKIIDKKPFNFNFSNTKNNAQIKNTSYYGNSKLKFSMENLNSNICDFYAAHFDSNKMDNSHSFSATKPYSSMRSKRLQMDQFDLVNKNNPLLKPILLKYYTEKNHSRNQSDEIISNERVRLEPMENVCYEDDSQKLNKVKRHSRNRKSNKIKFDNSLKSSQRKNRYFSTNNNNNRDGKHDIDNVAAVQTNTGYLSLKYNSITSYKCNITSDNKSMKRYSTSFSIDNKKRNAR